MKFSINQRLIKHLIMFMLCVAISIGSVLATGPSYVRSELTPIAINSKGDVLCKTRYEENQTGGYDYKNVYFGLCVLTKKKIVEYPVYKLNAQVYEEPSVDSETDKYMFLYSKWNNWFTKYTNEITKEETELINKYAFNDFDMNKYQVSDTISVKEFGEKYKINLASKQLKTLRKAHSLSSTASVENVIVSYVFGDKIICRSYEFDDLRYGSEYNFKTNLYGGIPYDYFFIDGVLFK